MTKNLKNDTLKAGAWNFSSTLVNQIRNFIVSIILARLLMPEDFGLLGMAMVFVGLTESFVDFGFGSAVIRENKVTQIQLSTVFWINLSFALFLTSLMFLLSNSIAVFFEKPQLSLIVKFLSISFLIKGLSSLQNALFQKELDYKTPFRITLFSGTISGVFGIILAFYNFGVFSLVFSQIAGWVISTSLLWHYSNWKPLFKFKISTVYDLWIFGYKNSLSVFIGAVFSKLDTIVIGKIFSASILGFFYKAQSINNLVVQYAYSSFASVLFPALSKIKEDKEKIKQVILKLIHLVCFTTFLFSGLMLINSEEIILILLTDKWSQSIPIFQILAIFTLVNTLPGVLTAPVLSIGESKASLILQIKKKLLLIFSIPIGLYIGFYEYVAATLIISFFGLIMNMQLVNRFFNITIKKQLIIVFRYALLFLIFAILHYSLNSVIINNVTSIIVKTLLYSSIFCFIHWKINSQGIREALNILKPIIKKYQTRK